MKKTAGKILRPRAIRNNHAPPNPNLTIEYVAGKLMKVVRITVPIEINSKTDTTIVREALHAYVFLLREAFLNHSIIRFVLLAGNRDFV